MAFIVLAKLSSLSQAEVTAVPIAILLAYALVLFRWRRLILRAPLEQCRDRIVIWSTHRSSSFLVVVLVALLLGLLEPGDAVTFAAVDAKTFAEQDRAAEHGEIVAEMLAA